MAKPKEQGMSRNKLLVLSVALLTIAAQLFIPITMAKRYEDILQTGDSYRFKVVPRDPADPFKGRYVVLNFPISRGEIKNLKNPQIISELPRNTAAYAVISKNTNGIARILDIQKEAPTSQNFIKIKTRYSNKEQYSIELPFNRYYAEESKAPKIESLLWTRTDSENLIFYADVKIKNGFGVIAELYAEDKPILEYLKQLNTQ